MILTKKIILALVLAAAAGTSHAQSMSGGPAPVGVLGQNYTELSFGTQNIQHFSPSSYDLSLSGNLPINPNLDLGAGYSYGWIHGNFPGHANTVTSSATAYTTWNFVKPFASLGLGYQWSHFSGGNDRAGLWGAAIGAECRVNAISLTPRISYSDDFEGSAFSTQQTTYEVEANYWVAHNGAVFGSVGWSDLHRSGFDSWNYRAGVRMKF